MVPKIDHAIQKNRETWLPPRSNGAPLGFHGYGHNMLMHVLASGVQFPAVLDFSADDFTRNFEDLVASNVVSGAPPGLLWM